MEAIVAGTASLPSQVVKRDGSLKPFDAAKILAALSRAGAATGEFSIDEARRITANVLRVLALRFTQRAPSIEIIQDCVEQQLAAAGRFTTARAYIVYRERTRNCVKTAGPCSMSSHRSMSTWSNRTGASTPTPTRAIRSAA